MLSTSAVFSALVLRTDEHPLLRVMLVRSRLLLVACTLAALFAAAALGFRARPWVLETTWGLAETGAAGPTGNSYGDPAGHTCVAVVGPSGKIARTLRTGSSDRAANMRAFAMEALKLMDEQLS